MISGHSSKKNDFPLWSEASFKAYKEALEKVRGNTEIGQTLWGVVEKEYFFLKEKGVSHFLGGSLDRVENVSRLYEKAAVALSKPYEKESKASLVPAFFLRKKPQRSPGKPPVYGTTGHNLRAYKAFIEQLMKVPEDFFPTALAVAYWAAASDLESLRLKCRFENHNFNETFEKPSVKTKHFKTLTKAVEQFLADYSV